MGNPEESELPIDEVVLAEILRGKVAGKEALAYAQGKKSAEPHPLGGYDEVVSDAGGLLRFRSGDTLSRLDGPALCHLETGLVQFLIDHKVYNALDHLVHRGLLTPDYDRGLRFDLDTEAAMGSVFYYDLVTGLEGGAPLEWALAYARGEVIR